MKAEIFDCTLCKRPAGKTMYDGKTKMGPWAYMCITCYTKYGVGLGLGKGQKYELQEDDGLYLKTKG